MDYQTRPGDSHNCRFTHLSPSNLISCDESDRRSCVVGRDSRKGAGNGTEALYDRVDHRQVAAGKSTGGRGQADSGHRWGSRDFGVDVLPVVAGIRGPIGQSGVETEGIGAGERAPEVSDSLEFTTKAVREWLKRVDNRTLGQPVGDRLHRELQGQAQGRTDQSGDLLLAEGSARLDGALA